MGGVTSYSYSSEPVVVSGGSSTYVSGVTSYSSDMMEEIPPPAFDPMWDLIGKGSEYLATGYLPVPSDIDFGEHPVWKIIVGKDVNSPPPGYYLPDWNFVKKYEAQLI